MSAALLLALPWVALAVLAPLRLRFPASLPSDPPLLDERRRATGEEGAAPATPRVSVVVPARNEARDVGTCLASLAAQDHPSYEVVVVDDRSEDATAAEARSVGRGNARRIRVLGGRPLPRGWFGKPWACHQGAGVAEGDLLLFTDADTTHAPDLLRRAEAGLSVAGADALTLLGRQEMGTFWEKVTLPQFFFTGLFLLGMRGLDVDRALPRDRWREAAANGQFILVRRGVYEAIGGHTSVAGEVVEDIRIAQELVRGGHRLVIRTAEDGLTTRMYRSLRELVDGFTKNFADGARIAGIPGRPGASLALIVLAQTLLWIVPPVVLVLALAGHAGGIVDGVAGPAAAWAGVATGVGVLLWGAAGRRAGISPAYGLAYPLGTAVLVGITLRSWMRGGRIEWKGRRYTGSGGAAPDAGSPPGDAAALGDGATPDDAAGAEGGRHPPDPIP